MNNFILMAEIIQDPQLRYTPDNQTPLSEMVVQFPGTREEDPMSTLKVVGWGNLAQEIQERYHQGDRVIIEGRLNMNSVDRPEGFKEKRAELTVQKIYQLGADASITASSTATPTSTVATSAPSTPAPSAAPKAKPASKPAAAKPGTAEAPKTPAYSSAPASPPVDYDDIPF